MLYYCTKFHISDISIHRIPDKCYLSKEYFGTTLSLKHLLETLLYTGDNLQWHLLTSLNRVKSIIKLIQLKFQGTIQDNIIFTFLRYVRIKKFLALLDTKPLCSFNRYAFSFPLYTLTGHRTLPTRAHNRDETGLGFPHNLIIISISNASEVFSYTRPYFQANQT